MSKLLTTVNRALEQQYIEFKNDIVALEQNLRALYEVILQVEGVFPNLAPPASPSVSLGLRQILGDFRATLEACKVFLADQASYASPSGPVDNWKWTLDVQDQVHAFRDSIAFLNIKVW